ncbi:S53 family peptidase [Bradyrhizobium sp. BR 10289]|uniref:S53 family peptidase n=1 Tax=Bradyrhizobium sp. BR 10289 TaxID=2749993 RepID=UPI001C6535A7|nr:S53 family peptidase [Bradyrhizobium sp. BR 10289]MBW7972916.1 S8/S53 family peptidase [Bradyrhizobium sp. BR 10289]
MASSTNRVALVNSARKLPKGAKLVGAADPKQEIEISVRLRARSTQPADDEQVMALGAQPPRERQYLSRAEFAAQMGADPADVARIDDFAHHHDLNVKSVHLASRTVKLTGTVKALSAAFGVKLNKVKHEGATYRMRKGSVQIPAELEGIVVGVHGLDNRPVAQPHFRRKMAGKTTDKTAKKGAIAHAAQGGSFSVDEIAKLYNFPGGETGAGQCIAIIELNDIDSKGHPTGAGYKTSDLKTFFKRAGIPMPQIAPASVDGGANKPGHSDADGEVVLDIEVAGAIAPGARIVVYFAPNTTNGFIDAVKAAVHDTARKPSVISISWGGPEDPAGSQQFVDGLNEAIRDAAAMGITVCVASGDNGSADMGQGWDGKPHADFPASSPFALACGGTNLKASNGAITEVVWNGGPQDGAGGGGVSIVFPRPAYQAHAHVPKSPAHSAGRGVPDVAGDADPATGYQIFLNGVGTTIGGTSAVAPLMAGLIARINEATTKKFGKTVGFINPLIYASHAQGVFRDITVGNNDITGSLHGMYKAGPGWDACSGLGVPNGAALQNLLAA